MPAPVAGSLETQGRFPLDYKYWVQNFSNIDDGLVSQGLMRFTKATNQLWIKLDTGWVEIPNVDSIGNTFSVQIGQVIQGNQAVVSNSGTLQNVILDFMLPQGAKGDAATIQITGITTSPDSSAHVYNDGDAYNASYRLQIPAGPQGEQGPQFTIDEIGTYADRSQYDGEAEGFTFLVDDFGGYQDGYFFTNDGNGNWFGPTPFKGPKGVSVYIAYANTYDGIGATFTPDSNKRYISFLNQNLQPQIGDFTDWLPITLNPSGFITAGELALLQLGDLANVDLGGLGDTNTIKYNAADGKFYPGVGGDMLRSTYDPNNNGRVDDSGKLEGNAGEYYLNRDNHTDGYYVGFSTDDRDKLSNIEENANYIYDNSQIGNGNGYITTVNGTNIYPYGVYSSTLIVATGNISAANLSGTNTGDETASTIRTKLGITTLSGSNTGDITTTTIGTNPNVNGISLTGQQLQLQPANATNGGVVTASGFQSFGGTKTFKEALVWEGASGASVGNLTARTVSTFYYGSVLLANTQNSSTGSIYTLPLTGPRSYALPDANGTIALTSDIPTTTITPVSNTTLPTLGTGYTIQSLWDRVITYLTVTLVNALNLKVNLPGTPITTPITSAAKITFTTTKHYDSLLGSTSTAFDASGSANLIDFTGAVRGTEVRVEINPNAIYTWPSYVYVKTGINVVTGQNNILTFVYIRNDYVELYIN